MPGLVSLPIERKPGFTLDSFTYLANLVRDPSAFSVAMDSPYKSMKDLVEKARVNPEQISKSEEHTSELQSLMRISYAVFCLIKKIQLYQITTKNSINNHNHIY